MSKLFYVIGASGAGKDTLMNYARQKVDARAKVLFAHRYITRPPFDGAENHVSLSNEEFELRRDAGLFALHWGSHGKYYGIGAEVDLWLKNGFNVIVNGSREYLPIARQFYPGIIAILIECSPETLVQRLAARGRESAEEIEKRIARSAQINADPENCIKIWNDSTIEDAGNELVRLITD